MKNFFQPFYISILTTKGRIINFQYMNIKSLFFTIAGFIIFSNLQGQHFMPGFCGVHAEDMELMEKMYPNDFKGQATYDRSAVIHIPIQFHLVATNSGSGRIQPHIVLKQLCKLNSDFSNTNIRFYLYDIFRNIDNTAIYSTPASNGNAIQTRKVAKALNVFITDKADPEGALGTVLGYYSPQGDYVVLTRGEAIKQSNTLSHEIGHFLSLRHTFHGWERDPWNEAKHGDTIKIRYTLDGNEIEFMNKENCAIAADMLCDTPPDYNFGFTSNGCNYAYEVWDFNNEKVTPQKENQMSYFSNCAQFVFTPDQVNRMQQNYNSTARNYLKNNPLPNFDTITGPVNLLQPKPGEQLNVFDGVLFDWEDVPNATHYILEIRNLSSNEYLVLDKSEYYATNLRKNQQYTYEVTPFSLAHSCSGGTSATFRTGNLSVTSSEDIFGDSKPNVYPHPVQAGATFAVHFNLSANSDVLVEMSDRNGRIIHAEQTRCNAGQNHHLLQTGSLPSGLYFLKLHTTAGTKAIKVLIAE